MAQRKPSLLQGSSSRHSDVATDVLPLIDSHDFEPHFRAVGGGSRERRGIRLERVYWDALAHMSKDSGLSMVDLVDTAAARYPDAGNLASLLRVLSLKWLLQRSEALEESASLQSLSAIVHASPVPTVIMSREKKILLFNDPFIGMLRNRFSVEHPADLGRNLRFQIDAHLDEVLEKLNAGRGGIIKTGFSIAINLKVMRGKIHVAPAPDRLKSRLIGYVAEF